jgi:hypothetical protein
VIYHTDTLFYGFGPTINFYNNIVDVVSHHLYNNWQTPSLFNSDYNCYLGIADKGVVTYGAHDILTNPLFTDTATLVFTLKNNSPCIDAGTNMYGDGFDYDGKEVPFGLNADIGAYEFIPSTGITTNNELPEEYQLFQNYPNPFNPNTTIAYHLLSTNHVTVKVFDVLGRDVATLVDEVQQPGNKTLRFNASTLASGIYFYRLQAGSFTQTKKLLLLR